MGYRHEFRLVENNLLIKIHSFTKEELLQWGKEENLFDSPIDDLLNLHKIGKPFYDFGKYYENVGSIQNLGIPLFSDERLLEDYSDYNPFIVGKEGLLNAIEHYQDKIIKMYENLLFKTDEERLEEDFDERTREQVFEDHLQSMYKEWKGPFGVRAINVNEKNSAITTSWKYEYAIFELVRLYKSTDWNKYGLLFFGW